MARAPVKEIPLSAQLRPVATPVDTYVRPGPSPLRGVADSLATVDKALSSWLNIRDEKAEKDQEILGRARFFDDDAEEFGKLVSEGKVPAQYSPFFVKGFKNAQGAAAGEALRSDFQSWWDSWDGKDSDDPQAFAKGFQEFLGSKIGTKDPEVLRGLLPTVEALQANATTQYTQYRHDRTVQGSLEAHGAVASQAVQDGVDDGLLADKGPDYETIFTSVDASLASYLKNGDPGGKAVDFTIDAMSAKILSVKDPRLLDWFDRKVPGKDYTYGATLHGQQVKNATVNSLESLARQQAAGMSTAERQEMERKKDEAQSGLIDHIMEHPDDPLPEELIEQARKNGDPTIRVKVREWQKTLMSGSTDPRKLARFYDDVTSGRVGPKQALRDALQAGVFGTAEDYRAAYSFTESYKTSDDAIEKTLGGQVARNIMETIRTRTIAKDPMTLNPVAGTSDEGMEATADFRQLVSRWIIANPNATLPEIEEQVTKFGKQITDRFQLPEGGDSMTDGMEYNRDSALPFGNAYGEGDQPGQDEEQPPAGQKAQQQGGAAPTEEDRKQAVRRGMGVEEYMQQKAKQGDAAAKPISYDPNDNDMGEGDRANAGLSREQATTYIDQAFTQAQQGGMGPDDQETILLDLIGKGESDGNYNAVFGNPNNQRDLGQYTLDEILGHQQDARGKGIASTAIGKYGFVYKTLRGLKAEMGLSGSEKFTPKLQDQLGKALLYRRGLEAYRAGRISKRQFALSLSQEWAALPNPNTGRSFYAGDGLNASRVPRKAVYSALGFVAATSGASDRPAPQLTASGSSALLNDPVEVARLFTGMDEARHSRVISQFIQKAAGQTLNPAETAWCAAFVNGVLKASGGAGTGKLNARSFLEWGEPVERPDHGDIVVFSRGNNTAQGHVGFYLGTVDKDGETFIRVLGGNQSNSVKESLYPASKVLGYRRATRISAKSA